MRLALLGLAASLSALPSLAQDVLRVSQSSATITAVFSRPGTVGDPVDRPNDDDVNVTTKLDSFRYGNSEILDALVEAGVITAKRGYSIVAVWADWPEIGNSYKFFLRKKGETPEEIDPARLKFELTDPFVGKNVRRSNDANVSGSDVYKSLATLSLGALTYADEAKHDTSAGSADGVLFGTGNYVRPARATVAIYRPASVIFIGYGEAADDVLQVRMRLGASSAVLASLFTPLFTPSPTSPSSGPDSTPVVDTSSFSSGSLSIGGGGTITITPTAPGSVVSSDVTLSTDSPQTGGTLVLGAAM